MCGIAGFTGNNTPKMQKIVQKLSHRGPDKSGIFSDDKITFGHTRLSIIDLSLAGSQPMFYTKEVGGFSYNYNLQTTDNKDYTIVFNGEIYNFSELKSELKNYNYKFLTNSDTETVLAAYAHWGNDCVKHFNGMWAFAIYDYKKQEIFLSRDRFGQKPLYFSTENKNLVFGSELKVFFEYGFQKKIDKEALNHFMIFGMMPTEQSIIQGIKKLLPAQSLLYSIADKQIIFQEKYYKTNFEEYEISEIQAQDKIIKLLDKSVQRRIIADVPVGAFLSGGVDSSAIVYFMRKYVSNLKTFSVGFDYKDFNEAKYAKKVAHLFGTEHFELMFTAKDVKALIEKLPYYYDEPLGDSSLIPTTLVSQVAAQEVKVVLSGTGADELFGGYARYSEYLKLLKFVNMPQLIKFAAAKSFKIKTGDSDKASKLQILLSCAPNELYLKLFSNGFRGKNEFTVDFEKVSFYKKLFETKHFLNNALNFDQQNYLPNDLLIKEDRATMASSIEGRVPFLDYQLVDFANHLPQKYKLKANESKYILKKALSQFLPNEILYRKKQGFGVPLKHYFRKELKDFAKDILFDFNDFEYYDKQILARLWQKHQNENADYSHIFWNLIIFNKWYKTHIV